MIVAGSRIGYYNDGIRLIHFSRRLIDKLQMNSAISGDLKVCSQHLFNQLRELGLTTHRKNNNVINKIDCRSYHRSGIIEPEFRIDVLKSEAIANRNTVTLVTHLTSDRFEKLLDIMTTWTD
ncbi:hypothetical protein LSH36_400g02052 [Paralvinella palmiformis]|uniref:Uncharacterized protein n=1 Tax=Paralvinella palmiformis TaxID=53620 RepID=A0AAD9JDX4_9ANNE|nr:hypothetical protein LSH36_400g02052 [Paralvinella palmiformis]